MIKRDTFEFE